jgi:diketogulonate reductase-like aldo/keto reductase
LDIGYRHIDTAKLYGNEASVGKAIHMSRVARRDVWITTKLWPTDFFNPRKALEASLRRLSSEYVDLYLIHWPTPVPIPGFDQKLWRNMENLVAAGLCKTIGVSNFLVPRLQNILQTANIPPAINQVKCSPFDYPGALHRFCLEHDITLEAYSPLTKGAKLDDPLIKELAGKYHKSAAQTMLRWALQKNIVVIPKSQHRVRIQENVDIYDFVIKPEDMKRLDAFAY